MCADLTRKTRGESTSSTIYYEMSESNGKIRKRDVYHPKDRSKLTFLIHGPGHPQGECKILGDFGSKYSKIRPTKDRVQDHATKNKFNREQENNDIYHHEFDEIILQDNKKLSVEDESNM